MADSALSFEIFGEDTDQRTFKLVGPLTLTTMFALQAKFRELPPANTVLDLSEVTYMDSAGVGCIVNAHVSGQKHEKRLALVGPNARVRMLLTITKIDKIIPVHDSLEQYQSSNK